MSALNQTTLKALAVSANAAAMYLDVCDAGKQDGPLDPAYYRACGDLLMNIFSLVDATNAFPRLLKQSAAARELAEAVQIAQRLEISREKFYPRLVALLNRAAA